MKNISNLFSELFDDAFGAFLLILLIAAAILIAFQSLLFWIGGVFFPSVDNLGRAINVILLMLLVIPLWFWEINLPDLKKRGNVFVGSLAIIGIYISVVWYFHPGILVGCIVLFYTSLRKLYKLDDDYLPWIVFGSCACMLYCLCVYFAMMFNGYEPAINCYGIIALGVATICTWFIPHLNSYGK